MLNREIVGFASKITPAVFATGILVLYLFSFLFFVEQILNPPCCDANQYLSFARFINDNGILALKDKVRTFFYPWILSLIVSIANTVKLPELFLIFFFQVNLYLLVVVYVANHFFSKKMILGKIVFIALCANIFLSPYFGITLTDCLYTALSLLVCVMLMQYGCCDELKCSQVFNIIFSIIFVTSLAIVTRPAAIWMIVPVSFWLICTFFGRKILPIFLLALFVGLLPLWIQVILNAMNFKVISFLPIYDLGSSQIKFGIENLKYATWLGIGSAQNFYPSSPIVNSSDSIIGISWYFQNPFEGMKLLFIKFFSAFDWDYLMPYPREIPCFKWFPSLLSFSILYCGLVGIFIHGFSEKLSVLGSRYIPFLIFIS